MQGYNLMATGNKQEDESQEAKLEVREEGAQVSPVMIEQLLPWPLLSSTWNVNFLFV